MDFSVDIVVSLCVGSRPKTDVLPVASTLSDLIWKVFRLNKSVTYSLHSMSRDRRDDPTAQTQDISLEGRDIVRAD